jgi:copper(I)-binding protein
VPRHSPSRILYAALSSVLVAALAGCAAGADAQTLQPYQAAEGTNAESGSVAVRNLLILADAHGKGVVHGAIVNTGNTEDRLVGIEAGESEEGVKVEGSRAFPLRTKRSLLLPPATGKPITVTGAEPGEMVTLTLSFEEAGPLTTEVQVLTEDHFSPTPREGEGH